MGAAASKTYRHGTSACGSRNRQFIVALGLPNQYTGTALCALFTESETQSLHLCAWLTEPDTDVPAGLLTCTLDNNKDQLGPFDRFHQNFLIRFAAVNPTTAGGPLTGPLAGLSQSENKNVGSVAKDFGKFATALSSVNL